MNRHYVNAICRRLAVDRVITRRQGADGELVNALALPGDQGRSPLEELWPLEITNLSEGDARSAAEIAWKVTAKLEVSTSRTQIVAGSTFLHHLLPDLLPPIDRQYTFSFFTGQKAVVSDRMAFLAWLPLFADIGSRCRVPIEEAIRRGGCMATGQAKVIDNAVVGFMARVDHG